MGYIIGIILSCILTSFFGAMGMYAMSAVCAAFIYIFTISFIVKKHKDKKKKQIDQIWENEKGKF